MTTKEFTNLKEFLDKHDTAIIVYKKGVACAVDINELDINEHPVVKRLEAENSRLNERIDNLIAYLKKHV